MAEIHIVYPPADKPVVLRYESAVMPGETIVWHIWSVNNDVRSVELKFDDATHTFFNGAASSAFVALSGSTYNGLDPFGPALGEVVVVGVAPKYLPNGKDCKYWVRAMKAVSGDLTNLDLDPKIIIEGP